MKNRVIGIIDLTLAAGAFIGINMVFHSCKGAMPMPCNYSVKGANFVLILLCILSLGRIITSDIKSSIISDLVFIAGGLELIFARIIGRCQVTSMCCNTKTFPFLTVVSLFMIAVSAVSLIITYLVYRRHRNAERE